MTINSLVSSGLTTYGCGFMHDMVPRRGVRISSVTMNLVGQDDRPGYIRIEFGKVSTVFPELSNDVDASMREIMSRSGSMC